MMTQETVNYVNLVSLSATIAEIVIVFVLQTRRMERRIERLGDEMTAVFQALAAERQSGRSPRPLR